MISGIGKVVVPVDDQERAKQFWTTRMGCELRRDESYGDERWIEVRPPDGGAEPAHHRRAEAGATGRAAALAGVLQLRGYRGDLS